MAASSHIRWVRNEDGAAGPLIKRGLFQSGVTQAVKKGEILILSSGNWVPVSSDTSMAGTLAIANEDINSGDFAGYYEIIVPRSGDLFEFDVASTAVKVADALYYSTSEKFATTGTNIMARVGGQVNYPQNQGHPSVGDGSSDHGTTIAATTKALVVFRNTVSYRAAYTT